MAAAPAFTNCRPLTLGLRFQQAGIHVLQLLNLCAGRLQQCRVCPGLQLLALLLGAALRLCPGILQLCRWLLGRLLEKLSPGCAIWHCLLWGRPRPARRCHQRSALRLRLRLHLRLLLLLCHLRQLLLQASPLCVSLRAQAPHLSLILAHQLAHTGGLLQLPDAQRLPVCLLPRLG